MSAPAPARSGANAAPFDLAELDRIVGELRSTLSGLRMTGELAWLVQTELPDAQQRLNQVLHLTETAAHTTLGAIEDAIPLIDGIVATLRALDGPDRPIQDCETLKSRLGEVLVAQGFQDLTGQMIRRVATLVGELERLLARYSGSAEPSPPEMADAARSGGPAIEGVDTDVIHDQREVDELLQKMGI